MITCFYPLVVEVAAVRYNMMISVFYMIFTEASDVFRKLPTAGLKNIQRKIETPL